MEMKIGKVGIDVFEDIEQVYNEGDDVETKVLETLKNGDDVLDVLREDSRWPILYQLSPERKNLVDVMDIGAEDSVLEIGAGMGAITGAVAQKCKEIDCVELSLRRSQANAWRNKDWDNIRIHVGNIENFCTEKSYDVVLMIGVLEYAATFMKSESPFEAMLKMARQHLKPGGKLYVAIENRLGMKYLAGCGEDHIGIPFVGVEGYHCDSRVRTFTRSELKELLKISGFASEYFYYPLPDYKLPSVIFSDDYLADRDVINWSSWNFDQDRIVTFDEAKALKSLPAEEFKVLANSFLVEARKGEAEG